MSIKFIVCFSKWQQTSKNSILQKKELWSVYNLLEGFISKTLFNFLCWDVSHLSRAVYAHIIHHSEMLHYSNTSDWAKMINFVKLHWQSLKGWDARKLQIENREHLIRILSLIIKGYLQEKASSKNHECDPEKNHLDQRTSISLKGILSIKLSSLISAQDPYQKNNNSLFL